VTGSHHAAGSHRANRLTRRPRIQFYCNHIEQRTFVMTIHDPSLRAALKTLKLTGMLDTRVTQTSAT